MKRHLGFPFAVFLLFLGTLACSSPGQGLAVVDVSTEPALASSIDHLEVTVAQSNGTVIKTATFPWSAADGGADLTVGVHVDVTGTVVVTVTGKDAHGQTIATADPVEVRVEAGKVSVHVPVVLHAGTSQPDGGTPDGGGTGGSVGTGGAGAGGSPGTGGAGGKATGGAGTGGSGGKGGSAPGGSTTGGAGGAATGGGGGMATGGGGVIRKWTTSVNLQDAEGGTSLDSFDVAIVPTTGDAVVVWADALGVRSVHYVAASNTWATNRVVVEPRGVPGEAHVGADGTGHFIAVWVQSSDQTDVKAGAYASRSADGVTWTSPALLGEGNIVGEVRLAVARGGKARIVWDQQDKDVAASDTIRSVYTAFFDGAAWGPSALVKKGFNRYERYPRIAISDAGDGVITSLDPDKALGDDSAWATTFNGATVGTSKLLDTFEGNNLVEPPDVAVNPSGAALVAWVQPWTTRAEVNVVRLSAGGTTWSAPERVARPDYAGWASPGLDPTGVAYLGWSQPNVDNLYQLSVSASSVAGTWTATTPFETDDKAQAFTNQDLSPVVRVAATTRDVLIGWQKRPSDLTFGPRVMWRSAAGVNGAPVDLGTFDKLYGYGMQASVTDDGRAAVAWSYHVAAKDVSPLDFLTWEEVPTASRPAYRGVWVSLYR